MKTRILSLFDFLIECNSKKVLFVYDTNKSMSGLLTYNHHDHPFEFYVHDSAYSLRRKEVKNYNSIQTNDFIWDANFSKQTTSGFVSYQAVALLGGRISKTTKEHRRGFIHRNEIIKFLEETL